MSPFGSNLDCRIFLSYTVFLKSKSDFITVRTFHYGISIFYSLIGKAVVLTGRSDLGAVNLFYDYSCHVDRIGLEFLDGGGGEESQ